MARQQQRDLPEKTCEVCGRRMVWRKAWAKNWDEVRYCSAACRSARSSRSRGPDWEVAILDLLSTRAAGATVCPSEVARQHASAGDPEGWRADMEPIRQAARRLVAAGRLEITQGGHVVDPSAAKGPIRLRAPRPRAVAR